MIETLATVRSRSLDPYYNLAVEQELLETVKPGQCVLYLWQNQNTVVIGRNQNPWKECRTALLTEEGGHLARRLSGGGAVFHDVGNLNFTFLMPQKEYDLDRQLMVIEQAVGTLGIPTERSGRNDILAAGRKFSGNAFYRNGTQAYHHGTLLVDVDMEKLGRYLNPSKAKLQAKGVESVRSRVGNLKELRPELDIEMLAQALVEAFGAVYGAPCTEIAPEALDQQRLTALTARNASWEWNYGQKMPFSVWLEERFEWGLVQLALQVEQGVIEQAQVYTDAMDWTIAPEVEAQLRGCRVDETALTERLSARNEAADVAQMLRRALL